MKKIILTAAIAIVSIFTIQAQTNDLVFDNTFNNGNPNLDNFPLNLGTAYSYSDFGRMKKLNDSVFVYFVNMVNWTDESYSSNAIAVISHNDGTVENHFVYSGNYSFAGGNPEDGFITDIITNPSNGHVYVVRNGIYLDGATNRRCVVINGYQYVSNGPSFPTIPNWGINASGVAQILLSNTDVYGAKGTVLFGYPYLASTAGANVAISSVISNGQGVSTTIITSNVPGLYSQVADIVAVSNSEVYIADNAFTYSSGVYNDNARILNWIPTSNALNNTYGNSNGIATISWNTQTNTNFVQDQIKRIHYIDNGGTDYAKLLVTGISRENIGAQYTPVHGKVTRLNNNGTLDNTFALNGTFAPNFSTDRFRTYFTDIDIEMDITGGAEGSYYISGGGSVSTSPNDPSECFLLAIDANGQIETGKGNNGFLFETTDYSEIVETIIIPGATSLQDKFVFNGMRVINPDPQMYQQETAIGRLVWGNNVGIDEFGLQNLVNVYPNPTSSIINIEIKESSNIKIVNLLGATVATQQLNAGNNIIDVSNLVSGVYFIHSSNGERVKFVKD